MREFEAKWIKPTDPIPEGWELAHNERYMRDHHRNYARMIVREVKDDRDGHDGADTRQPSG